MTDIDLRHTILIVTGASLRAEEMDRPLAYRLADEVMTLLEADSPWKCLVITDVLYLNDQRLSKCPCIALGGPGVNNLSALLYRELPSVLTIDNTLLIQMDAEQVDQRCCLWGMDHDQTVQALELFIKRGHLAYFLAGFAHSKSKK